MDNQNVKCSRCESDNLRTIIRQIKYYDEIPIKIHRCLNCQYEWKQSLETPNE
jgi:DNA-directed RNA polymerase subunit M/transcription elongation factor TFIIS